MKNNRCKILIKNVNKRCYIYINYSLYINNNILMKNIIFLHFCIYLLLDLEWKKVTLTVLL